MLRLEGQCLAVMCGRFLQSKYSFYLTNMKENCSYSRSLEITGDHWRCIGTVTSFPFTIPIWCLSWVSTIFSIYSLIRFDIWNAWKYRINISQYYNKLPASPPYLVGIDNDLALLLVCARDDEHVVDAGGEVYQALVLVGGQHVPTPRLQQVNTSLVHGQPQVLGPV